ncbi:hypothetical protein RLOC_00008701 [Lonchura striata]|uniref:Uncharacterized protein n=1 Tax=Lonchura striata TaxID=40157 RepID=A0A218VE60_9PASE|nr:hypothetical protein RLOC_00008701 [Lonchura striata domestica]
MDFYDLASSFLRFFDLLFLLNLPGKNMYDLSWLLTAVSKTRVPCFQIMENILEDSEISNIFSSLCVVYFIPSVFQY